jgi:hypothetical protein
LISNLLNSAKVTYLPAAFGDEGFPRLIPENPELMLDPAIEGERWD